MKSFCGLLYLSPWHCTSLQNQEKEEQSGTLAWQITCSCHLNRLIMIITDTLLLSHGVVVDLYLGNLFSCSQSRPCYCTEAKPDGDLGDFFFTSRLFLNQPLWSVSPLILEMSFILFIFSVIPGKHSPILLRGSQSDLVSRRVDGLID